MGRISSHRNDEYEPSEPADLRLLSMVAGFLAGYLEKGDYEYALKLGTASGGATAFSYGIGTKELIMELLGQLQ